MVIVIVLNSYPSINSPTATSQGYNWVLSRVVTTFNDIIWLTRSIKYENFAIYEARIGTVSAIFTEIDWRSQARCFLFSIALQCFELRCYLGAALLLYRYFRK